MDSAMLGIFFYYDENMQYHHKKLFDILDLMSKFGGLYGSLFTFLGVIGGFYNSRMFIGELVSL